jgi:hypothetical protein
MFPNAAAQGMAGRPCDRWLSSAGWCGDARDWGDDFMKFTIADCRACAASPVAAPPYAPSNPAAAPPYAAPPAATFAAPLLPPEAGAVRYSMYSDSNSQSLYLLTGVYAPYARDVWRAPADGEWPDVFLQRAAGGWVIYSLRGARTDLALARSASATPPLERAWYDARTSEWLPVYLQPIG